MAQELMIADDLVPYVKDGRESCTIRSGQRDIRVGELFFKAVNSGEVLKVNVTEVRHKTLGEITEAEARRNGAPSAAVCRAAMKRYYPDIGAASPVTIVFFDRPQP